MGLIREFKEFAVRGNVIDLAVGVIIGGAFNKIVTSLVGDMIMPMIGLMTGGVSIADRKVQLAAASAEAAGKAAELKYGAFFQTLVDFLIIAFCVFLLVKIVNILRRRLELEPESAKAAPPPEDVLLLREIRDALQRSTPRRVE